MALSDEILATSSGAQFWRADLHIHSFGTGGSYDVTDSLGVYSGVGFFYAA
jgi:hypothetical protein